MVAQAHLLIHLEAEEAVPFHEPLSKAVPDLCSSQGLKTDKPNQK